MIKTIKQNSTAEIVVKKSKFIANLFYVETEKEAKDILNKINKKYNDARHNCYAYIIQEINGNDVIQIQKSSDNGEPSGTAGAPLLDLLRNQGLCNILVVVTRYFGGILLGTGGLVKAYIESASKALESTKIINKEIGNIYEVEVEYAEIKNIQYNEEKMGYQIRNIKYGENVKITIQATRTTFLKLLPTNKFINKKIKEENVWICKDVLI